MSTMRHWDGDRHRRVILVPGMNYPVDAPLLWYARDVALRADWSVTELAWADDDGDDPVAYVNEAVGAALDIHPATTTVVVAKSIGTLAVSTAADRGVPGVWLTPLLAGDGANAVYVRRHLPSLPGPQLHIGGTADRCWNRTVIPTHHRVLELPGADHVLHDPAGPLAGIDNLRRASERMMTFMDRVCHGTTTE